MKFFKQAKQEQDNLASPSKRFLAYSIDVFILTIIRYFILMCMVYIWYSKSFLLFAGEYKALTEQGVYNINSYYDIFRFFFSHSIFYETLFLIFIIFIVGPFYWILFAASDYMGTPGKIFMKIAIVDIDNNKISLSHSIYRYFVALIPWGFHVVIIICIFNRNFILLFISILLVMYWYETSLLRNSKKALHDIICKTRVVRK